MRIGIDIGGTQIRVGQVFDNKVNQIEIFPNEVEDYNKMLEKIWSIIDKFSEGEKLEFIGIAMPGPLDMKNGIVLETPNLKSWNQIPIVKLFKERFTGVDVKINNDANVAALGQFRIRSGIDSLLFFTISTGIGAGFVSEGKILSGTHSNALEVANAVPLIADQKKDLDRTGIEFIASGKNIPLRLSERGAKVESAKEAFELYRAGTNKTVNEYFTFMENKLVEFFATAIYFFDPECIVLGGSTALKNKEFYLKIFDRVKKVTKDINPSYTVEFAIDIDNATLIGSSTI